MEKGADAFRSIGEVAKLIGVAPHVLRYWETQFPQLKPVKRRDGRRYYRPEDVRLVAGLCEVLREEGLTIRGARKLLARDRGETVRRRGAERLGEPGGAEDRPAAAAPAAATAAPAVPPAAAPAILRHTAAARPRRALPKTLPLFPDLAPVPALPEVEAVLDAADPAPIAEAPAPPAARPAPEAADPTPASDWLAVLAETAAALRAQPSGRAMQGRLRATARRLHDAALALAR